MADKKLYVLDTNVLVHDPTAMFSFHGAQVGIPTVVFEELDEFKGEPSARGRSTREAIRHLDALRTKGSLSSGVHLNDDTIIRSLMVPDPMPKAPFHISREDNEILLAALGAKEQGYDVVFVSKDLNARVKADALGLAAQDYIKEHISEESFYKGWRRIGVPAVQLKREFPQELVELAKERSLEPNEFVLVESQHNPHYYRVFRYLGGNAFKPVHEPQFYWQLKPRNPQQLMALDALLDDQIQFVTLFGPAGTGKTFLALLAGLHKVLVEDHYQKLLISRPVIPLGRDIGYLPGTIQEKLHSWMLPIYDNMDFISHASAIGRHIEQVEQELQNDQQRRRRGRHRFQDRFRVRSLDELIRMGKVSLEALTYMRGRSIPYQFIFIDEVQNLTAHEVKTIISRVGEGSKIVLSGDPYQIDSPYLDFSSNGLIAVTEKFKGEQVFAAIFLETSERSELSKLVSELL